VRAELPPSSQQDPIKAHPTILKAQRPHLLQHGIPQGVKGIAWLLWAEFRPEIPITGGDDLIFSGIMQVEIPADENILTTLRLSQGLQGDDQGFQLPCATGSILPL